MHKITFQPMGVSVEVDPANYPFGHEGKAGSILDIALTHGVQVTHACGGVGACGTCHVIVEAGMENLPPATEEELDLVDQVPNKTPNSRLACMSVVSGDVTVRIPGWNRNLIGEAG